MFNKENLNVSIYDGIKPDPTYDDINNVADISCLSNMYTLKKLNLKNNYVRDYSVLKTLNLRRLNI